ncbi:hypothetical protein ACFPYN_01155 [Paenisporosarcina macmurdoensis]|uniref:Uncharacterized protein n=1 Tax=Paenisporosarcina macmurdoensis TaxID=212659 RepID=A0ABW1L1G6_9BACL
MDLKVSGGSVGKMGCQVGKFARKLESGLMVGFLNQFLDFTVWT